MVPKPTDKGEPLAEITQWEVDSLARKLEKWSKGLPIKDQELLKLMLAHAGAIGGIKPPEAELIPIRESIEQATIAALRPLVTGKMIPTWIRNWTVKQWSTNVWLQSGPSDTRRY